MIAMSTNEQGKFIRTNRGSFSPVPTLKIMGFFLFGADVESDFANFVSEVFKKNRPKGVLH